MDCPAKPEVSEVTPNQLGTYSYDYTRKNTFVEERLTPEITEFLNGSFQGSGASKKMSFASRESLGSPEETAVFLPPQDSMSLQSPVYKEPSTEIPNVEAQDTINKKLSEKKSKGWKSYMGLVFTLNSGLMFAVMGLIVKYLKGYHAMNLGFFRFSGMLLPAFPFLLYAIFVQKKSVFAPVWPLNDKTKLKTLSILFGRAFVGCIAVISHFYAIQYMNVADAMIIGSCSPVFVTLVAHLFLGEKCGIFPILCAFLTIVGVGVISRPPMLTGEEEFDTDTLIGAGFALVRMFLTSLAIVFVRYLRQVHVALILFSVGVIQLLQNTTVATIMGVFSLNFDSYHLLLALLLALVSFLGQMSLTLALKCEQAGPFAVVRTCDVIFAFILQFIFLGVVPDAFSLIGGFIVIFAVCLTVFRKWVGSLPKDSPVRNTYRFVLK